MLDKELWRLGQTARVCFRCYVQIVRGEAKRLLLTANKKGREACCEHTPEGCLKGFFSGDEEKEKRKKKRRERERGRKREENESGTTECEMYEDFFFGSWRVLLGYLEIDP
ncbi:hypothetical protein TNCV_1717151 [Trichonephila clavipes]|nr:hypothetical protein TNCV_1717151 [Trichonephila clavipes]